MWKCSIHPAFEEILVLRTFLQKKISIEYDETLQKNEVIIGKSGAVVQQKKRLWKEIFSYFETYAIASWMNNYDYYYLKNALADCYRKNYDTLVVGSSYARFGYDDKISMGHAKNLALPSQDLYYASKIVKKCKNGHRNSIKNIIIGLGYYSFYSDLSKTENEKELSRISNVYNPIFEDTHNAIILPPQVGIKQSSVWDMQSILNYFSNRIYNSIQGEYFSVIHDRKKCKTVMWKDFSKEWNEISADDRERAGQQRAQLHNKEIGYYESYIENIAILDQLIEQCERENIKLYICVFPVTKEYSKYIDKQMIDNFWNALSCAKGEIHVLDLNECECFGLNDFNDMDHLSAVG
ncbi:hypothetical protein ACQRCQ_07395, partial [Lachnospiraceae bacterium SGI.085]